MPDRRRIIKAPTSQVAFKAALAATLHQIKGDREWQDLAIELDVVPSTLSHFSRGKRMPSTDLLIQFNDKHPGFLALLFRNYGKIESEQAGGHAAGRTRTGRRPKE